MNQAQLIILGLKVSVLCVDASTLTFVVIYSKLAPWWKSDIGKTLVYKDIMLLLAFIPLTLSLFFNLSRLTSNIVAWIDIIDFLGISAIMTWRCAIWIRTKRNRGGEPQHEPSL
jgi:hypothetical protein